MTAIIGESATLLIMAFALSMDAFSLGLGMGMYKLSKRRILKIGLAVGLFHVLMPLMGMAGGRMLSAQFGDIAGHIGGAVLFFLGVQMVWSSFKEEDSSLLAPVGIGLVLFALTVSLDSFSVGLTLGIYGARTAAVLTSFGMAAMVLTWLGLFLGRRLQHWVGTYSELLGGSILIVFGIKLLFHF